MRQAEFAAARRNRFGTCNKTRAKLTAAAALALSLGAAAAHGQNVLTVTKPWNNIDGTPPGNVSNYDASSQTFLLATGTHNSVLINPTSFTPLVQLKLLGNTVFAGSFTLGLTSVETFTLSQNSNVSLPTYLMGSFNLGDVSIFGDTASAAETVTITNSTNGTVGPMVFASGTLTGSGSATFPYNTFTDPNAALGMGTYNVTANLTITGSQIVSLPGLTTDYFTGLNGLLTSVEGSPTALAPSRATIAAPTARANFFPANQTYKNVKVGLLENGNPFVNNVALPATQVTDIYPAGGAKTNYFSEHALATAGIIGATSANSENAGIAPGVSIISASYESYSTAGSTALQAATDLAKQGVTVINMSFGGVDLTSASIDNLCSNYANLTFVDSAGNAGPGSLTAIKMAYDPITVGAMNNLDTQPATFSATEPAGTTPVKPDIMAPGSYITAPLAVDANGNGTVDDFGNTFTGASFYNTLNAAPNNGAINPITGGISGTSFASPMVAGSVALLNQYDLNNPALHTMDARVMKAVLLNSATRTGIKDTANNPWRDNVMLPAGGGASTLTAGAPIVPGTMITQSLNSNLGSGLLNDAAALAQYQPNEISGTQQNNTAAHLVIDTALNTTEAVGPNVIPFNPNSLIGYNMWDQDQVAKNGGTVDYLLGDIDGGHLKATLDWNAGAGDALSNLELSLWQEGANVGNQPGIDAGDMMIATTMNAGEDVKLFDFTVPNVNDEDAYFLEVTDNSAQNVNYGLAINVPEPACIGLVMLSGSALLARRRQRNRRA